MLLRTKPLAQLTPGEYAEYFANELTVRHNRPDRFAKSIAVAYSRMYHDRGLEPEHAAGVWVQEFGTKTPPAPAKPPPKVKADQGMGNDVKAGSRAVIDEALRRPVKPKKR